MDSPRYTPIDQLPQTKESHKRRLLLVAGTTLALLFALSLFWQSSIPQINFCPPFPEQVQIQEPRQNATQRVFSQTKIYSDLTSAADKNWTRLIPPNGGFVVRQNEEGKSEMAGVSMFHQLHCLSMIRMAVQDMRAGRKPAHSHQEQVHGEGEAAQEKLDKNQTEEEHWVHCLDYLVQAVLCAADGTVEPAHEGKSGGLVVDGYNIVHQCGNPDLIWSEVMGRISRPGWLPPVNEGRR
jgi:hypothetical protein